VLAYTTGVLLTLSFIPTETAAEASLAFVVGPGSYALLGEREVRLPEGARLELLMDTREVAGRFAIEVRPGGMLLPELTLPDDEASLRVRISGASSGWLSPGVDGIEGELALTLGVELSGRAESAAGTHELALTTGEVQATEPAELASRAVSGAAIDPASRSARFVAATRVPLDAPVAPGEPVLVVIEGQFEGLPAELR
jgi:hypothetical protein